MEVNFGRGSGAEMVPTMPACKAENICLVCGFAWHGVRVCMAITGGTLDL